MTDAEGPAHGGPGPSELPDRIVASVRKFSEYVLVPGHGSGKDGVFIDLLGFRPRNAEDARELSDLYVTQARERWERGEVRAVGQDKWGRRFEIEIEVRTVRVISGWVLRDDNVLWLATPFSGFARRKG